MGWLRCASLAAVIALIACGGRGDEVGPTGFVQPPDPSAATTMTPNATNPTGNEPAAGSGAPPPAGNPQSPTIDPVTPTAPTPEPVAPDECGLSTGRPGDELCISPPPKEQGFQLHIGPTDYDNPEARFVLEPGQEDTGDFGAVSGNETDIHFMYRQFRMRPGAHHMIITQSGASAGSFGGRRIGTANTSGDYPAGGVIAPENEGVGIPLPARANINVSLHSINVTDQPLIREIWVNFWYRDSAMVTETAQQLFATGDVRFAIQPGQDTILGPYTCNIQAPGRMLWFYGHRHANNVRFSAWRVRGTQRELFYEGYNWEEPVTLEYASNIKNPVPDPVAKIDGGFSGILDMMAGDKLEWECRVINQQDTVLRFTNNTYTGEMCIMDAELVGTSCTSGGGFPGL